MDDRDLSPFVRRLCRARATETFHLHALDRPRAALLAAGFFVAKGRPAGVKEETTIALTPAALGTPSARRYELLAAEWISRWNRSQAKFPSEIPADQRPAFAEQIRQHLSLGSLRMDAVPYPTSPRRASESARQLRPSPHTVPLPANYRSRPGFASALSCSSESAPAMKCPGASARSAR